MKPADSLRLRRPFCLLVLSAAFILTVIFLIAEIRLVRFPGQRDYGEGHVLWMASQILDSSRAWRPLDSLPYVAYPYPPLYILAARIANLVWSDSLTAGRGLSLLATLGTGAALAFIVAFSSSRRMPWLPRAAAAAFAGVLPFEMTSVAEWCSLMRVDMLALFLMYAGFAVYVTLGKKERWQYAAAILFVLALFTKQTMLSAPLACLSVGLLTDWKRTLRVGAFAVVLGFMGVWLLNSITGGGFLINILTYNINPFSWKTALKSMYDHVRICLPWVAIASAAVLGIGNMTRIRLSGWRRFLESRNSRPYSRAVVLASANAAWALVAMSSLGKMGSNYNHVLAWDVAVCLLCGLFMFRVLATWSRRVSSMPAMAFGGAVLLLGLLLPATSVLAGLHRINLKGVAGEREIMRMIRHTDGPVYSENLTLVVQAGKPVEVEPATVTMSALAGSWDERRYVELFDQQYFRLLVANDLDFDQRYTPQVAAAIRRRYFAERQIGNYTLYRPARPADSATALVRDSRP